MNRVTNSAIRKYPPTRCQYIVVPIKKHTKTMYLNCGTVPNAKSVKQGTTKGHGPRFIIKLTKSLIYNFSRVGAKRTCDEKPQHKHHKRHRNQHPRRYFSLWLVLLITIMVEPPPTDITKTLFFRTIALFSIVAFVDWVSDYALIDNNHDNILDIKQGIPNQCTGKGDALTALLGAIPTFISTMMLPLPSLNREQNPRKPPEL